MFVRCGEDLPRVRADAVQLQQVLLNLTRNSVDAMRERARQGTRHTVATEGSEQGGVRITVTDHGHGVSRQLGDDIFIRSSRRSATASALVLRSVRPSSSRSPVASAMPITHAADPSSAFSCRPGGDSSRMRTGSVGLSRRRRRSRSRCARHAVQARSARRSRPTFPRWISWSVSIPSGTRVSSPTFVCLR